MPAPGDNSPELPLDSEVDYPAREALIEMANRLEAALQAAVRDALIQHKRAGNPIAVWENDRVVWIPAEEIEIPDDAAP
jgi:hypothetical protein